ncbi:MAG TPA: formylmethanofuran dehydrogenase subunit C [Methylotenera sp.]|nr:formylmethanofuran dehydrogenase subunit C [Methylotenera sp.]HPH04766.1 formylmethanofuran dehydrogenase subunit C [Methylotenera sp.]HPN01209.1 formylmethanofuran dehydrogenase subunit C [Methylotenera sp.]
MMALTFSLKKTPSQPLDCSQLTANGLAGLSLVQMKNLPLAKSNLKVADFFEISGDDAQCIIFTNSTSQLHYIGHKMTGGIITIDGDAGDYLGAKMQNGTILCHGNAGNRVGDQMRRGLILVDGNVGNYCASRMIAGTIGVFGQVGAYLGFAMKRGTILLTQTPKLHATIQSCGKHTLPFLALLFKSFCALQTKFSEIQSQRVERFAGDLACGGKGEILVMSPTEK